jgi:hypothetical protein
MTAQLLEPEPRTDGPAAAESGARLAGDALDSADAAAVSRAQGGFLRRFFRNLAVQDGVITVYWIVMMFAVAFGDGPGRESCLHTVAMDFALFLTGLLITRGGLLKPGSFANEMLYRVTIFCAVFLSYFQLRVILPAVSTRAVDASLVSFDLRVFGVEPSLAWDHFVNPRTTEWFAFFYFGYFFILSAHVLPMLLNATNRFRIAHFTLGILFVFLTGHLVYMLVPGWGPYHYLAGQFQHPLEGGLFWSLVKATVDSAGAQKDIFPSLHTAAPTYFAIFSYLHRKSMPFKYTWKFVAFAATQIIIATMFLRWHYLVDIVAGLTLATTAALLSFKIVTWETKRRERAGVGPTHALIEWPWTRAAAGGDNGH